jgi:thiamine biosynthesis lipoprotein
LSKLWNFDRLEDEDFDVSEMQVPDAKTIAGTIKDIGYQKLVYDEQTGILSTDELSLEIELGAIGKGYAIEQAMKIVKASNASGGMISAGSSICVYGTKTDGSSFRVALRDPRGETDSYIGLLNVSDCSISTSGDYERYFEQDGIRYHHILDPRTGYPADSGLMQVTIICDDSMTGDALSTACFVLGLDDGMALASQYGVKAIFVDTDKNVWYNDADILDILDFYGEDAGYILQEYQ